MKFLSLFLFFSTLFSHAQPYNRSFESASGRVTLLGEVTIDRLTEEPFDQWYATNYDEYDVDESAGVDLSEVDSITIFMGTWCGDSKREVPRFIKILESANYEMSKLKILCLNTGFQNYKQAPEREERGVNIHRVPTFIFHNQEGEEIDRIVEEPVISLEEDIQTILSGKEYNTAYPIAEKLIDYFEIHSLREMKKMKNRLIEELASAKNIYELNTYGYVLWTSFQIPKAQFVFELNSRLFPKELIVYQTYARFMNSIGESKEALDIVKKGLKVDPENENLMALQSNIQEELN